MLLLLFLLRTAGFILYQRKLYEISVDRPQLWREMKVKELLQIQKEELEAKRIADEAQRVKDKHSRRDELANRIVRSVSVSALIGVKITISSKI